ncbi:hypothetical protein AB5R26_003301 [Enterobacter mori]
MHNVSPAGWSVPVNLTFKGSDIAGQIEDTKKPAGLAPCGLSGLHQTTLVIADGEFWGWRPCAFNYSVLIFNIFV